MLEARQRLHPRRPDEMRLVYPRRSRVASSAVIALLCALPVLAVGLAPFAGALPEDAAAIDEPPAAVLAAAADGLAPLLAAIPPGAERHFRFASRAELARAELDRPFRVFTLDPAEIRASASGTGPPPELVPTSLWIFPVVCDGEPRTLLTVDRLAGRWAAVDIGGLSPAVDMYACSYDWPDHEGYRRRYVRVFAAASQFIAVSRDGETRLIPLETTARALGLLASGRAYDAAPLELADVVQALTGHLDAVPADGDAR